MGTSKDVLRGTDALISSSRAKAKSDEFDAFADFMLGRGSKLGAARRRFSLAFPANVDHPSFGGIVNDIEEAQRATDRLASNDASVRSWGREVDDVISGLDDAAGSTNTAKVLTGVAAVAVGTAVYLAARHWSNRER
jgi:hypothetical protein